MQTTNWLHNTNVNIKTKICMQTTISLYNTKVNINTKIRANNDFTTHHKNLINTKIRMQTTISLHNTKVNINTKIRANNDFTTQHKSLINTKTYANNDFTAQHDTYANKKSYTHHRAKTIRKRLWSRLLYCVYLHNAVTVRRYTMIYGLSLWYWSITSFYSCTRSVGPGRVARRKAKW